MQLIEVYTPAHVAQEVTEHQIVPSLQHAAVIIIFQASHPQNKSKKAPATMGM